MYLKLLQRTNLLQYLCQSAKIFLLTKVWLLIATCSRMKNIYNSNKIVISVMNLTEIALKKFFLHHYNAGSMCKVNAIMMHNSNLENYYYH